MITCICGLPGEGKSYLMAEKIFDALYDGRPVFTNFPFAGCHQLTYEDIVQSSFPEGSVLFIDEANSWFRNRDWKDFPKEAFQLFMHHRHFHMDMVLVAQSPGTLDVNIRDIVNEFIWCSCFGIPWVDDKGYLYKHALWFKYEYYSTIDDLLKKNEEMMICRRRELARPSVFKKFDSYYKFIEMNRKEKQFKRWEEILGIALVAFKVKKYKGLLHFIVIQIWRITRLPGLICRTCIQILAVLRDLIIREQKPGA